MVMIGTSSEETTEFINENDEYKVVRLPIRKFYIGESKELIWQPSLLRVTRKIEVVNTRTNKIYPVGSMFYLGTDCTPKFTAAQVASRNYAVQYRNTEHTAKLAIGYGNIKANSYTRSTGIIRSGCSPYGYQATASSNTPSGGWRAQLIAYMGCSDYWDSEDANRKMMYTRQVLCGGHMATYAERDNGNTRGYYIKYRSQDASYHSFGGGTGHNTRTLANGGLPLSALDWQRLEYFSFRCDYGTGGSFGGAGDRSISGGMICWFTNYYEEEDFYKLGVRCY